jgi:hypothetical protein
MFLTRKYVLEETHCGNLADYLFWYLLVTYLFIVTIIILNCIFVMSVLYQDGTTDWEKRFYNEDFL